MPRLPAKPSLDQLKKQAKDLLFHYRNRHSEALARLRTALPAAAGKDDQAIAQLGLRLRDAQSCLAREYGFASWADLKGFVEMRTAALADGPAQVMRWLRLVYAGDICGGTYRARPAIAARMLDDDPGLLGDDPYLACAVGDEATLRQAIARDAGWVNRAGGPLNIPPLVAVAHSSLVRLADYRQRLLACARLLLEGGASPNQSVGSRWEQASPSEESDKYRLSALYGAAGQNRDPELTGLLLKAGADPNDGESLYHSLESPACTELLLKAGARVVGSNAIYRVLDLDSPEVLQLLLTHGGDPNESASSSPTSDWGTPLLWAIRRRRSPAHIAALIAAGADASAKTPDGTTAPTVALRFGLTEVAALLEQAGASRQVSQADSFIAACARGDEVEARRIQSQRPDLPGALPEKQLRLLPELAAAGGSEAAQAMVRLGWPIAIRGGDWGASALNHAVFRGDAELARFLLAHGASWTEQHSFGDNVCGTLSWASVNEPNEGGDWLGCAEALVEHGMPGAQPDPASPDSVLVDGRRRWFSDEVTDFLLAAGARQAPSGA